MFTLDASYFDFSISMDSPFTVQQGTAELQVRNGKVTTSSGTGMFAGIFPGVGTSGDFSVPFDSNFLIDYNLGTFNNDPVGVQFTLDNGGSVCITPEPSLLFPLTVLVGFLAHARHRRMHMIKS